MSEPQTDLVISVLYLLNSIDEIEDTIIGLGRYDLNLVMSKFQNEWLTYFDGESKMDDKEPDDLVVKQTAESLVIDIDSAMASEYLLSS